jgi:hypothetical protein
MIKIERHLNWLCAWLVHQFTGIALGSKEIHPEQTSLQTAYRGDVSPRFIAGDLPGGRFSGFSAAGSPSPLRRVGIKGNPRA